MSGDAQLMGMMSPAMQARVGMEVMFNPYLRTQVKCLRGCERAMITRVCMSFDDAVFVPNETIPNGALYVLEAGLVLVESGVLTKGKIWGEEMILQARACMHACG